MIGFVYGGSLKRNHPTIDPPYGRKLSSVGLITTRYRRVYKVASNIGHYIYWFNSFRLSITSKIIGQRLYCTKVALGYNLGIWSEHPYTLRLISNTYSIVL